MHIFNSSAASYFCILALERRTSHAHVVSTEIQAGLNFPKLKLPHFIPQMP